MCLVSNNHTPQPQEQKAKVLEVGSFGYASLCMLESCEGRNERNLSGCSCMDILKYYGNWHGLCENVFHCVRCVCFSGNDSQTSLEGAGRNRHRGRAAGIMVLSQLCSCDCLGWEFKKNALIGHCLIIEIFP